MTPKRYFAFGCLTILIQGGVLASQNFAPEIHLSDGAVMGSNQAVSIAITMQAKTALAQQPVTKEMVIKQAEVHPKIEKPTIKKAISKQAMLKAQIPADIQAKAISRVDNPVKTEVVNDDVVEASIETAIAKTEDILHQLEDHMTLTEPDNSHNQLQVDAKQGVNQHAIALNKPTFSVPPAQPNYPKKARKRGFEGTATIEVMFNQIGEQLSLTIIDSSGFNLLDAAAINAVEQWQFAAPSPQTAYAYTVRVPVKFALN